MAQQKSKKGDIGFSKSIFLITAFFFLIIILSIQIDAALNSVGPIFSPSTDNYPSYYSDNNNLNLLLCLDQNNMCILTPQFDPAITNPPQQIGTVLSGNFPDESFYYIADALVAGGKTGAAKFVYRAALEQAFLGSIVPGEQIVFLRINFKKTGDLEPNSAYIVTHPYGQFTINTDTNGDLIITGSGQAFRSEDMGGCAIPNHCFFDAILPATNTNIGPFLKWDSAFGSPPVGYIGDPGIAHKVIGGPNGNKLRIEGPNAGGVGTNFVETDLFNIAGKILLCTDNDQDGFSIKGGACGLIDCNDNNINVNPNAAEVCNNLIDDNCNGLVDAQDPACSLLCTDNDQDGFSIKGGACGLIDCNDNNINVNPNAADTNCNGVDNNCNGNVDEGYVATQTNCGIGQCAATGLLNCVNGALSNSCTPSNPIVEVCDNIDNDCNGVVDNGVLINFFRDNDLDLFGNNAISQQACFAPIGFVSTNTDCNDNNINVNPNAAEVCNNLIDDNCNGLVDAQDPLCSLKEDCTKKPIVYACQGKSYSAPNIWSCKRGQGTATKCNISQCVSTTSSSGWKLCSKGCDLLTGLCKGTTGTITCSQNSNCGTNGFNGNTICQNGNVFQNFTTYTCNNPGTTTSSCSNSISLIVKQNCLSTNQICSNGICITNTLPILTKINVKPVNPTIIVGNNQQFTVETLDQYNNPIAANVVWSSSNNAAGTINLATGQFLALSSGTTTITATSGAVFGNTLATINSVTTKEDCTKKLIVYTCQGKSYSAPNTWSCKRGQGTATQCNIGQCVSTTSFSGWKLCSKGCDILTGLCKL